MCSPSTVPRHTEIYALSAITNPTLQVEITLYSTCKLAGNVNVTLNQAKDNDGKWN